VLQQLAAAWLLGLRWAPRLDILPHLCSSSGSSSSSSKQEGAVEAGERLQGRQVNPLS